MPVGMTATARARNVTAGHPAQLTLGVWGEGGVNVPRVRAYAHIEDADVPCEVSYFPFDTHTHSRRECRHDPRNNLLHSPLLADHLISSESEVPKTEEWSLLAYSAYLLRTLYLWL